MLLTNSAGSVRLYTVIHSRSELQCILPIGRIFQDGGRLVVFIFIIAQQRSSDGRQVRLIGTRPKASRAIKFAINRPTTNAFPPNCFVCLQGGWICEVSDQGRQ